LESAKHQKLSLDIADPETGFQPFVLKTGDVTALSTEATKEGENKNFVPSILVRGSSSFGLPTNFWDVINSDVELKRQLDEVVMRRAEENLIPLREETRKIAEAEGLKIGIQRGMELGVAELKHHIEQLNVIAAKILEEKEAILRDHEAHWCKAFLHLLKRFIVPRNEDIVVEIRRWLESSLENFSTVHKLKLHLSPGDYEMVTRFSNQRDNNRFEIIKDTNVQPGEVHCETDAGGIFFSPNKEAERLDELVEHFVDTSL
jgi:flagellar biosynthesis/type III secretory pathway protein FliH